MNALGLRRRALAGRGVGIRYWGFATAALRFAVEFAAMLTITHTS
ncbi:hypothetical protein XACM_1384 [Xanthomonas euvesicatoria pv. citrumelo F1]|nr:hypothetical protein XACM_1384 [Xanthomonas euvesicatoria pv. citrumelo F1]